METDNRFAGKPDKNDRVMSFTKWFFFAFLFFTFALIIYYCLTVKAEWAMSEEIRYINDWTVTDKDGVSIQAQTHFRDEHFEDGMYTMSSTLPDKISDNSLLCIFVSRDIAVYVNGELRKKFDSKNDVMLPGGHVKAFYITVPLQASDSGGELFIERSILSGRSEVVPEVFVSGIGGVTGHLFSIYGVSFYSSMILLMFSVLTMIVSIGLRIWYKRRIDMLYGALSIFVIACWLATNSYLFPFIFGHYHIDGVANYMFCLMLPFGLGFYLDSVQEGRYRHVTNTVMIITAINSVVWCALDFAGVIPFYTSLLYMDIVLAIITVFVIGLLVVDLKRGNAYRYKYTLFGFLGFLIMSVVEILSLFLLRLKNDDLPMLFGLAILLSFVVVQQISDIKRINSEKQHAIDLSDAKTRFLANMSHEIRTPINSILGMNEMILKENKDKVIGGYAKNVKSSGRMLLMLVNDVLDFSKIEAGRLEITNAPFSLSRLLTDVVSMISERAQNKKLEFKTVIKGTVPDGQISDEFRIRQVLINLIGNAVKYTDKGSITLEIGGSYTAEDDFNLEFAVRDTGRGIKSEDIGGLFDAFSRADIKKNRSIEGTGLGLAIVKNIIENMGGSISVESEYGKGSVFTVSIPVKVTDKTPVRDDLEPSESSEDDEYICDYTAPSAKLLAVDDNRSNLTIVKLFLKEALVTPDLCTSGQEAILKCREQKYDLILLDHMMPSPDGIETLKIIREDENSLNRDTTAIVLTANAIAGSRQIYLDAGFADYLTKPLEARKLEQTVKQYLPKDKVIPAKTEEDLYVEEFLPIDESDDAVDDGAEDIDAFIGTLRDVEGMDIDRALEYCGGDAKVLKEILVEITREAGERSQKLRDSLKAGDFDAYRREAHTIKGLMATIGLKELSERAKQHEFAARDGNAAFMEEDSEAFIAEYSGACDKIAEKF